LPTPAENGRSPAGERPPVSVRLAPAFILLFTLLSWNALPAQAPFPAAFAASGFTGADTIPNAARGETSAPRRGKKSSLKAVGLSAILPGAGQVYTEQYWKVPVILGLGGYWVYEWSRNNDRYHEFRDLYAASIVTTPPQGDGRYLSLREFYRDQRDSFTWYLGALYLLNVVDAFVGAELYDFDVSPDLGGGGPGLYASLKFRL